MQIEITAVGKLKEKYWVEAQNEYLKRLSRFADTSVREIEEEKLPEGATLALEEQGRKKEGARILQAMMKQKSMVIVLDLAGETPDSQGFAKLFREWTNMGKSAFTFIVGGSTGLSPEVLQAADYRLCLSRFTFPHQMARIVLLEQIYRTMKILGNETYHK